MGTPAKHERYPKVIRICRVIPNLCSQAEILWAFTEVRRLCVALGELCGSRRRLPGAKGEVSVAVFNLVSSKPSETFLGTVCHLMGISVSFGKGRRLWLETEDSSFL